MNIFGWSLHMTNWTSLGGSFLYNLGMPDIPDIFIG